MSSDEGKRPTPLTIFEASAELRRAICQVGADIFYAIRVRTLGDICQQKAIEADAARADLRAYVTSENDHG